MCSGAKISTGTTYVVRVASSIDGSTQSLVETTRYSSWRAGGMTIGGGGSDLVFSHSGTAGTEAAATTYTGQPLGTINYSGTFIEGWREAR